LEPSGRNRPIEQQGDVDEPGPSCGHRTGHTVDELARRRKQDQVNVICSVQAD